MPVLGSVPRGRLTNVGNDMLAHEQKSKFEMWKLESKLTKKDVFFWRVPQVVHPAQRLLHPKAPPFRFGKKNARFRLGADLGSTF